MNEDPHSLPNASRITTEPHFFAHQNLVGAFSQWLRTDPALRANRSGLELKPLLDWAQDEVHQLISSMRHRSASETIEELRLLTSQIREKFADWSAL